jgi:hypothetical protein
MVSIVARRPEVEAPDGTVWIVRSEVIWRRRGHAIDGSAVPGDGHAACLHALAIIVIGVCVYVAYPTVRSYLDFAASAMLDIWWLILLCIVAALPLAKRCRVTARPIEGGPHRPTELWVATVDGWIAARKEQQLARSSIWRFGSPGFGSRLTRRDYYRQ